MSISTFFDGLWQNFKTAEEQALLKPLATMATNYANNPSPLNFLAQASLALAQIEAAQPQILAGELQNIATMLNQVVASLPTTVNTTPKT